MSGVDKHGVIGDVMGLNCHVIMQDHVIKGSGDYVDDSP